MSSIPALIEELLSSGWTKEKIAIFLNVDCSAIDRWLSGKNHPRPFTEGALRRLHLRSPDGGPISGSLNGEAEVRDALRSTLQELREVLYRSGRLSSRNEALDELSKLLFAHIMSIESGAGGIKLEELNHNYGGNSAEALSFFVKEMFEKHLPRSLSVKMGPVDFKLRIKSHEERFAQEVIRVFERMAPVNKFIHARGLAGYDLLNDFFGQFLADSFVDEKELGQYLTPIEVVQFMVRWWLITLSEAELEAWCHPQRCLEQGLILDPSCGVGSFLMEVTRQLHEEVQRRHGPEGLAMWVKNMTTQVLVGIDKSERMIRLALTNLAMLGFPAAHLHLANSLMRSGPDSKLTNSLKDKAQLILTNPPFGAEFTDGLEDYQLATHWAAIMPRKVYSELLFMERYTEWLTPGGKLFAIVPDSILTNKGLFHDLRKGLSSLIEVKGVVSLPSITFGVAGTTTKTSILYLQKRQPGKHKPVITFFANCQDIGYNVVTRKSQRIKVKTGHNDLPSILRDLEQPLDDMAVGRFIPNVTQSFRWDATYHASLPKNIEMRIHNPTQTDVYVRDVASLSLDKRDPRRFGSDSFVYIEISDVDPMALTVNPKEIPCSEAPSRARLLVRTGDILVSTVRPGNKTVAVIPPEFDGAICSSGFAVLRPLRINPYALARLLQTDFVTRQLLRNNIGIAYPAIDQQCILAVLLPVKREHLIPLSQAAEEMATAFEKARSKRLELEQMVRTFISSF